MTRSTLSRDRGATSGVIAISSNASPFPDGMPQAASSETHAANGTDALPLSQRAFWALTFGSIGVVYGDIGTSPLYAFREAVLAAGGDARLVTGAAIYGVLSLIFWSLIFVVTLKYVLILLRADNNGEGGTLALTALAFRARRIGGVDPRLSRAARAADRADHSDPSLCEEIRRRLFGSADLPMPKSEGVDVAQSRLASGKRAFHENTPI